MSILILDRRDRTLSLRDGVLRVSGGEEPSAALPLARIERILIRQTTRLDSTTLAQLWAAGITVQILSGRQGDPGPVIHGLPARDARIRIRQTLLLADPEARAGLCRLLLRLKLAESRRVVAAMLRDRPAARAELSRAQRILADTTRRLRAPETPPDPATALGLEGTAAAAEMAALAAVLPPRLGFTRRRRRPPPDPANAVLSLLATLATAEASRIAWSHGLDPAIGVLHLPAWNRPAAGCDLVEVIRPALTRLTWRLFAEETLRPERFERQPDGACLLGKAGRGAFYPVWEEARPGLSRRMARIARHLVRHLRQRPDPWGSEPDPPEAESGLDAEDLPS